MSAVSEKTMSIDFGSYFMVNTKVKQIQSSESNTVKWIGEIYKGCTNHDFVSCHAFVSPVKSSRMWFH